MSDDTARLVQLAFELDPHMTGPVLEANDAPKCAGCEFVKQFTPHDGGWCKVHGNIAPQEQ